MALTIWLSITLFGDLTARDSSEEPMTVAVLSWLSIYSALGCVTVAIHEAGHLVAGWLVGFRFHAVKVGPILVWRKQGKTRLAWIRRAPLDEGWAWARPRGDHLLRLREAVGVVGGPAANLLAAVATITAIRLFQIEEPQPGPGFTSLNAMWILRQFVIASFVGAGLSLLPHRGGQHLSDGAILRLLIRGGPEADRYLAVGALAEREYTDEPARDWPAHLVEKAIAVPDGSPESIAGLFYAY